MRALIASFALLLGVLAVGALAVAPASAKSHTKHCKEYYFAPQYKHVKPITIRGGSCRTARGVARAYEYAITSSTSSSGSSRTGVCVGGREFGVCPITYKGREYSCNRPTAPGVRIPTTCTRKSLTIHFKG